MKLFSKLLGVSLLILFSSTSLAQNYYVCDTGSDTNDGKSEAKPFKTHAKAIETFTKMFAGDSVLYCRGGKFHADTFTRIANSKCGPSKVCTIGDYGSSDLPKPIIYGVGNIPFNFQNGGDSRPDGGYHLKNIDLIALENSGAGIMLYNEVNDLIVDNFHIEGFAIGFYAAGANKASSGNRSNNRIVFKNSTVINNRKQGWLGGCNDCLIENNHFENNGNLAVFDHNIYIDSPIKEQSFYNQGITIRGNTLTKSNMVNGRCSGVSLVAHGILKDLVIDNNLIKEEVGKVTEHCWGIGIDPGNALDESFIGLKITNNKLINVGNTGIGCASCVNVLISNNTIIDEGNVLRSGIAVPNKKTEDSIKSDNVVIENNKIILNHELGYGINLGGSNVFTVRNNDISTNQFQSRSRCFMLTDANLGNDVSQNLCDTHTKVSIIDQIELLDPVEQHEESVPTEIVGNDEQNEIENTVPSEDDFQIGETLPQEQNTVPAENGTEIADSNPVNEPKYNEQPTLEDELVDNSEEQNTEAVVITPIPYIPNNKKNSNIDITETYTNSTSVTESQSRKATGGGGQSKSSGSKSSSSTSFDEQQTITDDLAYFETVGPVINSGNTQTFDTTTEESKTIQNSSPSIIKMKDVLKASQEDLSSLDPSECRASANGKCLMK